MDVETEMMFKRMLSKVQEIVLTFKKALDKTNGRIISIEDRVSIMEQFMQENENQDPSEMIDIRAKLSLMDKNTRKDIGEMLQILQSMKEAQISLNSRIEILEKSVEVKEPMPKEKVNTTGIVEMIEKLGNV
jgi:hypothetical protein